MRTRLLTAAAAVVATATAVAVPATAASAQPPIGGRERVEQTHDFSSPLSDKQRALHKQALEQQAKGKIATGAKVAKMAKGQFVELTREGEDAIWTVLGEFSDLSHNQIAQPDRSQNNTTIWSADFSQPYYQNLLFSDTAGANSMRNYYKEQSSGRYAVNGDVTDWTQVPETGAYYGSNNESDAYAWLFVRDSVNAWYADQKAAGKSDAQIADYLARFDVWDRYDYDGDGNFNEPDGYIDHFQSIHSGEGEEAGGGTLGDDAIWSHRWYAFYNNIGSTGPGFNKLGGIKIGDSNLWIGDYTIEPENGGVGVFTHEFGHDLGLPDEYDTSGNAGGAENSTAFWTLMSSGSWGNTGKPEDGIGGQPFHLNAWDKWFLGWLNYDVVRPGDQPKAIRLGPAETNTKQAQAAIVVLPDKQVTKDVGSPYAGTKFYYSGAANDLSTTMTRSVTLPASGDLTLTAQARWNIESDYDYAYLSVNGTRVVTSVSNSTVVGEGIQGLSGGWTALTADLSAFAGQTVTISFGYWTDGGVQGDTNSQPAGFSVDDIAIPGQATTDGAETDAGWTYDSNQSGNGFHATTGSETFSYFNAYVAENRQYIGYDANLATGPYNFGFLNTKPDWVEHFPYQDGMLVWYYDSAYSDNNVGDHPGEGQILPVDANPGIEHWADGSVMRGRIQAYDATFGLQRTDSVTLHLKGVPATIASKPANPVFDDSLSYYVASDSGDTLGHYQAGWLSVDNPHTGTKIQVVSATPGRFMQVVVTPPKG